MFNIIEPQLSFIILISLFLIGAFGSLLLRKNDAVANLWGSFFAIAGSFWGMVFAIYLFIFKEIFSFSLNYSVFFPNLLSFHFDKLSLFFIFTISLVALFCSIYGFGYVKHFYKKYRIADL